MEQNIWNPIHFDNNWKKCDTSVLEGILPSWLEKRKYLNDESPEYKEFIDRLKRQHAIETGVIEKLYDLKEGITETFIKEGFVESYLQHGDTNIPAKQLMLYLTDNFKAIEFVFDLIKDNRPLSKGFLLELHQLITQHQDYIDALDPNGNLIQIELLKGQFKQMDNNPKRQDGTKFIYCPPVQVDSEIENMLRIYKILTDDRVSPIIIASWLHHAFTVIHPFQDGNGRVARLLATSILVKNNLFPLTITRFARNSYISALEKADSGEPQSLVTLFCEVQKKSIESILNLQPNLPANNLDEMASLLSDRILNKKQKTLETEQNTINQNRIEIFNICHSILEKSYKKLQNSISDAAATIHFETVLPEEQKYYYYTHQITEYAKQHQYYFNKAFPRGWFQFSFHLDQDSAYKLIISIHHLGYDDSTIAIGTILEYSKDHDKVTIPLTVKPYTMSIVDEKNFHNLHKSIESYLTNTISISLAQIIHES
ncbi:MAG: Fic family protein [Spirochaetota bacterium]